MDAEQTRRRIPDIKFRVLIIGRANAGKTTILQRVCDTTESPTIYRGREVVELNPSVDRGEHLIDDELVFSKHRGYVFHDSKGIESGSVEELKILKDFIQRKCEEKRLAKKLHAIWYCVPMDNHRPGLDLKFYDKICPDPNVPVIAVFTKYDQFIRNVQIDMFDEPDEYPDGDVDQVTEKLFQDHYLHPLGADVKYVRLKNMQKSNSRCDVLVEKTAAALNEDAVALMLLAVQKGNIGLSVKEALRRVDRLTGFDVEQVIRKCLFPFPYIWLWDEEYSFEEYEFEFESSDFLALQEEQFLYSYLNEFTQYIKSLPTIQNLVGNGASCHHFIIALILLLKHATLSRLSNEAKSALLQEDQNYQKAKIDSMIQVYLKAFSPEDSVMKFSSFIMDTDIVLSQHSVKTGD